MANNPNQLISQRIYLLRGHRVMLDTDLAQLYGVQTFNLNKAVKRNIERFPKDFMFQLTTEEMDFLTFQIGMSKPQGRGGRRTLPYAFTQEGVAMLSTVLRSSRAVQVNIEIMRAFVRFREMLIGHKDLVHRLDALEKKYDDQFKFVFSAIRQLMNPSLPHNRRKIGF